MTTITIDLPDDLLARARVHADTLRISVAEMLEMTLVEKLDRGGTGQWDPSLTPEDIAAIEEGLTDIAAGRTRPWAEVRAEMQALVSK